MANNRTSKYISLILRHKPEVIGITLDEHGWARVDELIAGVNRSRPLDMAGLEETVRTDEKRRYSFNEDKTYLHCLSFSIGESSMDLIEEYLNNIANMKLSLDDYGDRKKVRKSNRLAVRNRKIAAMIEQKYPELKDRFICLLDADDENIRAWAAHHALELMSYDYPDRKKALRVIEDMAENDPDSARGYGNAMWLKQYYEAHPADRA